MASMQLSLAACVRVGTGSLCGTIAMAVASIASESSQVGVFAEAEEFRNACVPSMTIAVALLSLG